MALHVSLTMTETVQGAMRKAYDKEIILSPLARYLSIFNHMNYKLMNTFLFLYLNVRASLSPGDIGSRTQ